MSQEIHSPHFINNEDIYELSVGTDPKTDIRYTVGNEYTRGRGRKIKITFIEFDQNSLLMFGVSRALVYAELDGKEILWKVFQDIPMSITCRI